MRVSSQCAIVLVALLPSVVATAAAQEQSSTRIRVNAAELVISGRVQMQYNTTSVDGEPPTEMLLRRVRFGADVTVNDIVRGRVQPEFAGERIGLADVYAELRFSPAFSVWAGKAHRPFGVMEETTSLRIVPIERGVRIRGAGGRELSSTLSALGYSDRDVGIQVRGTLDSLRVPISYAAGVFAGPVHGDVGDHASHQYVARVRVEPLDAVRVGVAWSRRDFALEPVPATFDVEPGDAFLVDLEFGAAAPGPGPYVAAQAATGDYDPHTGRDFSGAQVWASYRFPMSGPVPIVEPLFRVSHASIDALGGGPEPGGSLITPGINVYLGGLNRLMLNLDLWRPAEGENERSVRMQVQMAF